MFARPRNLFAVVALAAFAATGCTTTVAGQASGAGSLSTDSATPPPSAPTTTPRPYATTTPTLELNDQTVKPGTKLKFGEQAIVPFYSAYAKGLVGITATVESVKAPDADIDGLPLSEEDKTALRGKNFFFVRTTMVDIDGANFEGIHSPTLSATTKSGGWPGTLLGVGDLSVTGCDSTSMAPSVFSAKGAKYEQCQLYFGVPSDPVTSLAYTEAPYERAATRAVTWKSK